jgi:peptide/nickel transport system substrate-binding protein
MKRKLWLILVFVLLASMLAGCGGNEAANTGTEEPLDIVYYAYNSEPVINWDPAVSFSNGVIVLNNVYETLLRFNPSTKEFENLLATDYTYSDDGLTWTFKLREGVKFHDGTDFTAEAVKYSIERTKEIGQGASYIWEAVEEIKIIDDYTVEFHLAYPSPVNLIAASPYGSFIVSPSTKDKDSEWFEEGHEVGTGPYMLESTKMGDEVILTKFEEYWNGWEGEHFDKAIIKNITETSSRRQLMEKGDADITHNLPPEDFDALKEAENITVKPINSFTNLFAMLNTEKPPLDNPKVRQALAYAFPYKDVINYAVGGYATQAKGAVPLGHWGHGEELYQYNEDLDKAKALLEEAGIKEGELKLLLTYMGGDEVEKKSAELFKANLSKIGVELELRGMPWESQWSMARNTEPKDRQDIFLFYWWPDVSSPISWLYSLFHSEEEILFNLAYYKNPEVDKMMEEANEITGTDIKTAEEKFIETQEILVEESPALFIMDKQDLWVTNSTIKGFEPNPSYPLVVFFYDIYREK